MKRYAVWTMLVGALVLSAARTTPVPPGDSAVLYGSVTDENHVPIPGATVRLRHTLSQVNGVVRADQLGDYQFTDVRPGRYSLRAEAKNHEQIWICEVIVPRGERVRQDLVLRTLRPGRQLPTPICPERDTQLRHPARMAPHLAPQTVAR